MIGKLRIRGLFFIGLAIVVLVPRFPASAGAGSPGRAAPRWVVSPKETVLEIAYGSGTKTPQYGALHLDSGYFRLVPGSDSCERP